MIRSEAFCPECGFRSARRHGRYVRSLADLPAHGRTVQLRLSVRRFRCLIAQCPVKTFSEAVPVSLAQPHGRRTGRFQDLVAYLGWAMGGRPAQALGRRILLRQQRHLPARRSATGA
ncbi:transposase family protein [Paracoccus sp. MKU1]|uniref:transposase family protein n=1 Tax=Paracoccus sp. MKU1 TaxID=1745182 RepID=UPI001EF0D6A8|nr:transposase family protein [Paracoccus sp. MKU1]